MKAMKLKPTEKFDLLIKLEEDRNTDKQLSEIDEIEMTLKNLINSFYIKESELNDVLMVELGFDDLKNQMNLDDLKSAFVLAQEGRGTTSKFIHIESVVRTRLDQIIEKVINISRDKIKRGETFKIEFNPRDARYLPPRELLLTLLLNEMREELKIECDEKNPDWFINIEVVGENTGISVLNAK